MRCIHINTPEFINGNDTLLTVENETNNFFNAFKLHIYTCRYTYFINNLILSYLFHSMGFFSSLLHIMVENINSRIWVANMNHRNQFNFTQTVFWSLFFFVFVSFDIQTVLHLSERAKIVAKLKVGKGTMQR